MNNTRLIVVDRALLNGSSWAGRLDFNHGVSLYAALGEQAIRVGPWVLPVDEALDPEQLALPHRLGVSFVDAACSTEEVLQHFAGLRTVTMEDGQSFYLRWADARTRTALMAAWPDHLLACIKGPVASWRSVGRDGHWSEFAPHVVGRPRALPRITLAQFESLVQAGATDRMAAELEELREPNLSPVRRAEQFAHVDQALQWCGRQEIVAWTVQRSVARQVVLTKGGALVDASFATLARSAAASGNAEAVHDWMMKEGPPHEAASQETKP